VSLPVPPNTVILTVALAAKVAVPNIGVLAAVAKLCYLRRSFEA
jgi:hypothetical protein